MTRAARTGRSTWSGTWELAARRWRVIHRSGALLGAILFVAAGWAVGHQVLHTEAQAVSFVFLLTGLSAVALAAGTVARDFESGMMVLDRLQGARPVEVVLGAAAYNSGVVLFLFVAVTGLVFGFARMDVGTHTVSVLAVMALGLVAWVAFLVFLGSFIPGVGNSAVALALVVLLIDAERLVGPSSTNLLARVVGAIAWAFPPNQVVAFLRGVRAGSASDTPIVVLAAAIVVFLVLATLIVGRREPASGWKR